VTKLSVLDLFSGIGGFSLGLERTGGFYTKAFCEIDKKARLVLNKHWPDVPIYEDVAALKGEDIGSVDVICGGFPCQDISLAGKGAGLEGARSGLWFEFHRLIKEIKPKYVIAENVAALRSRGLDQVLRSLSEIGYDAEWHCIPASAVGAPHQRDRIWIVADSHWDDGRDGRGTESSERQTRMELGGGGERFTQRNASEIVADPSESGRKGRIHRWADSQWGGELGFLGCCRSAHGQPIQDWWAVEPAVGRVANGIPRRVDRIKQLGNAVVPQIPEILGRAILKELM